MAGVALFGSVGFDGGAWHVNLDKRRLKRLLSKLSLVEEEGVVGLVVQVSEVALAQHRLLQALFPLLLDLLLHHLPLLQLVLHLHQLRRLR